MTSLGGAVRVTEIAPGALLALAAAPGLGDLFALVRDDEAVVGRGVAVEWPADAAAETLTHALRDLGPGTPLRALAAVPFDVARAPDGAWGALGCARLVVPRHLAVRRGARATLLTIDAAPPCLARPEPSARAPLRTSELREDAVSYEALVRRALDEIAGGATEKLVPARIRELTLDRAPSPASVLERLVEAASPRATSYAVTAGALAFVGRTPETLVTVTGSRIATEAVAGTARPGDERGLETSPKELREHEIVVDALAAALARWGEVVRGARTTRDGGGLTHLVTPLHVEVRAPVHALEVARALSPTPAVGGAPTARSLAFLRDEEGFDRGLFAGALGSVDAEGHGTFVVAIRGALLHGARARLFAGAGIVRGSDPSRELEETSLKLAAVEAALGLA